MAVFNNIQPGDRIEFVNGLGQVLIGRAQRLLCFEEHVVVDIGNGRPAVVNRQNYRRNITAAKRRTTPAAWSAPSPAPMPGMRTAR